MSAEEIRKRAQAMMPEVVEDLEILIRHPSVAFSGYPYESVNSMADATVDLLRLYGLYNAHLIDTPGGYPSLTSPRLFVIIKN